MPELKKAAPAFSLPADDGSTVSLKDLKGKWVVLYFYPKDDTSGCTVEACEFNESMPKFKKGGAVILGVSPDPVKSHVKFKKKFDLTFPLLADEDHAVCEAYDVWKEKSMYGRKYMGVERTTFVIDPKGKIAHIFAKVTPKGHAEAVQAVLKELASA